MSVTQPNPHLQPSVQSSVNHSPPSLPPSLTPIRFRLIPSDLCLSTEESRKLLEREQMSCTGHEKEAGLPVGGAKGSVSHTHNMLNRCVCYICSHPLPECRPGLWRHSHCWSNNCSCGSLSLWLPQVQEQTKPVSKEGLHCLIPSHPHHLTPSQTRESALPEAPSHRLTLQCHGGQQQ